MDPLGYAAKFDPFLSLAQSKERKGSNFAIWQYCCQALRDDPAVAAGDGGAARALPRDAAAPPARPAPPAAAVGAARPRAGVLGVAEHTRAADSEPGGGESAGSQMNTDSATTKKWS